MKKKTVKNPVLRIVLAVILICISIVFVWWYNRGVLPNSDEYQVDIIPPTCTDSGYSLYTHVETGEVIMRDIVSAIGHDFGDWQTITQATIQQAGLHDRTCKNCGECEDALTYPELAVPVLGLEGNLDGISKTEEVAVQAAFIGEEMTFESYATVKYQGHSSLHFDKKNYTLKLWKNNETSEKNKITFSHWNEENKYILKADYLDSTMSRNLVCADVWAAVTASRDGLPREMKNLSNYGAIDGFVTALYINGAFIGLYNMNLHKDDDLFGMEDGEEHAIVIINDPTAPEAHFRELAAYTDSSPWEIEFCGTDDTVWVQDKLNQLIAFVMNSNDETFRTELRNYLDVNSAIDYLLSMYVLGLTGHGSDELILVCYNADQPWIASMYDMETGFGLSADGTEFIDADQFLPGKSENQWDSATESLLWDRLIQNFYPEICTRYTQLRKDIFTPERLLQCVSDITDSIPDELYAENQKFHGELPSAKESISQIQDYIGDRIQYTDDLFLISEE